MAKIYDKPGAEASKPLPDSETTKPQLPGAEAKPDGKQAPDRQELNEAEKDAAGQQGADTPQSSAGPTGSSGAAKQISSGGKSLYSPGGTQQKRSVSGFVKKHKVLTGALGGFFLLIIVIIFLLLSLLKIPNLAAHITAYQFARVARNSSEHTAAIESEDIAVSTVDDSTFNALKTKFSAVKDGTWGSMWDKVNSYRPDKIVENLQRDGTLDFKYKPRFSALGIGVGKKLTAIVINGEEIPYNSSQWKSIFRPVKSFSDSVAFTTQVNTALADAMEGRSVLVRGAVAKSIRDLLDIRLQWWNPKTYPPGEDAAAAEAQAEKDAVTAIDDPKVAQGEVPQVQDAAEKAQAAVTDCVDTPSCLADEVKNKGALPAVAEKTVESVTVNSAVGTAIGIINPLYAIAVPACLIYDGSLQSKGSGQTVDSNNAELQRSYYAVAVSADQQKNGFNTTAAAVGAQNWKLGDISQSIPEQRAMGNAVDTTNEASPQASTSGSLSNGNIFSALGVPFASDISSFLGGSVHIPLVGTITACGSLTNLYVGGGVGLVTLVASFFTGPEEETAGQGLARVVTSFIDETFSKKTATQLGLTVVGVTGATLLARLLVADKSAVINSGLATGPAFDNAADAGGNLNANAIARSFYGRPLTNAEVAQSANADKNFANGELAAGKSTFQRYFAISNADSVVSKLGWNIRSHLNFAAFSSLSANAAKLLNPANWFSGILNFGHANVLAANGADTQNYGIVQWGWSDAEESLIKNDPSYQPLDNQAILQENPAAELAIAQKYNPCFGYAPPTGSDINASTTTPDAAYSMGVMLSGKDSAGDSYLERASNGDITGGLCSPANLGPDSPAMKAMGLPADLLFRYRLEMNYELSMDQLQGVQNPVGSTL